jgi:hypothetical protein
MECSRRCLSDDALPDGVEDQFRAAVQIQLLKDVTPMGLHCAQAQVQYVGNFLVILALSQQL